MMAAFIVAIRGTVFQAVLLGLSAAFSHTLIIWVLAAFALYFGQHFNVESTEPYFQIGSGIIVLVTAVWMAWRTSKDIKAAGQHAHGHSHGHDHAHEGGLDTHASAPRGRGPSGGVLVDTGHGNIELSIFETGVPPQFELRFLASDGSVAALWESTIVSVETVRPDGVKQQFTFAVQGNALVSTAKIPEPHEFTALLKIDHGGHQHSYKVPFSEGDHSHNHPELGVLDGGEYQDAHEKAHALEIEQRFANREVTNGQIVLFGLSGGLLPCPAAFSILVLCLQLKKFTIGFALVLCFSVGLAITLVTVGSVAAWSVQHASSRMKGFSDWARRAPYLSSGVLTLLGLYLLFAGAKALLQH
jgi:nickel/cobalt exporter